MKLLVANDSTWKVERKIGLYVPSVSRVVVRSEGPIVAMFIGPARVELRTPEAHKMGFALVRCADDCIKDANNGVLWQTKEAFDFVALIIDGRELHLEAKAARQLAGALLRRADIVDIFQTKNNIRIVQ